MPMFVTTTRQELPTHVCSNDDCGDEFAITMICRPTEEHLKEYPEAAGIWSHWTSSDIKPFCPHCGHQVK